MEETLFKDMAEQTAILQTIKETHDEFRKLFQRLKEDGASLMQLGPKKFREKSIDVEPEIVPPLIVVP